MDEKEEKTNSRLISTATKFKAILYENFFKRSRDIYKGREAEKFSKSKKEEIFCSKMKGWMSVHIHTHASHHIRFQLRQLAHHHQHQRIAYGKWKLSEVFHWNNPCEEINTESFLIEISTRTHHVNVKKDWNLPHVKFYWRQEEEEKMVFVATPFSFHFIISAYLFRTCNMMRMMIIIMTTTILVFFILYTCRQTGGGIVWLQCRMKMFLS